MPYFHTHPSSPRALPLGFLRSLVQTVVGVRVSEFLEEDDLQVPVSVRGDVNDVERLALYVRTGRGFHFRGGL